MDLVLALLNAFVCALLALVLIGAILSPRVHDGIVIKTGMSAMVLGFGAIAVSFSDGSSFGDGTRFGRALLLLHFGGAVIVIGYLLRAASEGHPVRRLADWIRKPSKGDENEPTTP